MVRSDPKHGVYVEGRQLATDAVSTVTDDLNNVHWASNPDEIDDLLNNTLPDRGGIVRLRPGSYTDTDWSQRIDIPNNDDSHYVIHMRGSDITLSSFSPTDAYIKKPTASTLSQRSVEFYGPKILDVTSVTDPPAFLQLDDIENSIIYVPGGRGAVDAVVSNSQTQGSGHMNRMCIRWRSPLKGYEIIGGSNDRSYYWGQIQNIQNIGIDVQGGANNYFHAQPESGQGSATGYKFDSNCHGNTIYIAHQNVSLPLDIEGANHRLRYMLPSGGPGRDLIRESNTHIRPRNISIGEDWTFGSLTPQVDGTALIDTPGTGSVSIGNFNRYNITPSSDGDTKALASKTRLGILGNGAMIYCRFKVSTGSNSVYRLGIGGDSNNFIGIEWDTSNTNWKFRHVEGGTGQTGDNTNTDTTTAGDTNIHELVMNLDDGRISIGYDWDHIHTQSNSIGLSAANQGFLYEAENSGGSSAELEIFNMEWLGQ